MDESDIRQLLSAGRTHEAFDRIVERFQTKIFHLALGLTGNDAAAADLAQEALLRVWRGLPSYHGGASLSTWIYTIARNVCLTELKRAARRRAVALDAPESAGIVESLASPDSTEPATGMDVDNLLAGLPEKYQRVVRLFYLEQKSYEETASLLGVPVGTVKTFLFRARKELARTVARDVPALVRRDH